MACFGVMVWKGKRRRHRATPALVLCALLAAVGCGAGLSQLRATQLRQQLRDAMNRRVSTLTERDDNSRLLAHVVDEGALHNLDRDQVRAALGPGQACRVALCSEHGFEDSDWYYEIGHTDEPKIRQLPVLIVGFDLQGRAARIWTLTTH